MKYKVGSKVQWKWLGSAIEGVVKEVHTQPVTKTIKGKSIKRNGSDKTPAYLVESVAGNLALKLETELLTGSNDNAAKAIKKSKRPVPRMFS